MAGMQRKWFKRNDQTISTYSSCVHQCIRLCVCCGCPVVMANMLLYCFYLLCAVLCCVLFATILCFYCRVCLQLQSCALPHTRTQTLLSSLKIPWNAYFRCINGHQCTEWLFITNEWMSCLFYLSSFCKHCNLKLVRPKERLNSIEINRIELMWG